MSILLLLVVFMFFVVALDVGIWYLDHRQAQNQADAVALAAAQELPTCSTTVANSWIQYNGGAVADLVSLTCPDSTTVQATVRRQSPALFGGFSGITSAYVSAKATAKITTSGGLPYPLIAMDPTACGSLALTGNASVTISGTGGGAYVRSTCGTSSPCASGSNGGLTVGPNATLTAGRVDVVGGFQRQGTISTPPTCAVPDQTDPLASLAVPTVTGSCMNGTVSSGTRNLTAGLYSSSSGCSGIVLSGNSTTTMCGIYVVRTNSGQNAFSVTGNANLDGTCSGSHNPGVIVYITCNPSPCNGNSPGAVNIAGNGTVRWDGHSSYNRVFLFIDRTASSSYVAQVCGNGSNLSRGIIYGINSGVGVCGNGTATWQVISRRITNVGNASLSVVYDSTLTVGGGTDVYLSE